MQVSEIMSRDVDVLAPDATVREAARHMSDRDIGAIPVAQDDKLIGMVTDRDLVIRCLAEDGGGDSPLRQAMTDQVRYCFDDQDVEELAVNMSEQHVRRMPVVDRDKRLVGIVSLGDISKRQEHAAGEAMEDIVEASVGSQPRQSAGAQA